MIFMKNKFKYRNYIFNKLIFTVFLQFYDIILRY